MKKKDYNLPEWVVYEDRAFTPEEFEELLRDDYMEIDHSRTIKETDEAGNVIGARVVGGKELGWVTNPKTGGLMYSHERVKYLNEIVAYDTETSSWRVDPKTGRVWTQKELREMDDDERKDVLAVTVPMACVYAWMLAIRGKCVLFRSWEGFLEALARMAKHYKTSLTRRLIVWVHNLAYEFQFMRRRLDWHDVFSVGDREVVRCLCRNGIEFRDSLILAKLSLEKVGEDLETYKIKKQVGSLDYEPIRTPETPLTPEEVHYCVNDCLVLNAYIWEKCAADGDITKIPMTDTGYVRRHTRRLCLKPGREKKNGVSYRTHDYQKLMRSLTLSVSDYRIYKAAFAGGFTHGCWEKFGVVFQDERTDEGAPWWLDRRVSSADETSAYPAHMLAKKYPMTRPVYVEDIKTLGDAWAYKRAGYALAFKCRIWGLESRFRWEHVLSRSKGVIPEICRYSEDNGRLIDCEYLETAMTDVELEYLQHFYKIQHMEIYECRVSKYEYLPREIIEATLFFYAGKTTLKGVEDRVQEYLKLKGELNSEYGMMVMDIVRQICTYTPGDEWKFTNPQDKEISELDEEMAQYNDDPQRFTFFPWGVWITAYSRARLLRMIGWELYSDHVYCDTDSLKHLYHFRHVRGFEEDDARMTAEIEACLDYYGLDRELMRPETKDGVKKPIGVWDDEGTYKRFKMLGAKRYLAEAWDKKTGAWVVEATVAGCRKKSLSEWLRGEVDDVNQPAEIRRDPFEVFDIDLIVPPKISGRMISTYIDEPFVGVVTDYLGHEAVISEESAVSLMPSAYKMSISDDYAELVGALIV